MRSEDRGSARAGAEDFAALLHGVKTGVPAAWDQCYRWLAPAVAGYLCMQGSADADDLTSEVFLAMFAGIGSFTGTEANFRSWVFVIAHRRLTDERRRRFRRSVPESLEGRSDPVAAGTGPDDAALVAIGTERVAELCTRLAPDQRDVVLLRILGDLTVDQVAEVLGKSQGAVKQLQRRGFEAIRRLLEREGVPL